MRRHRRKGGNKEKVFGCDLMEHLNASSQEIPLVLRCCSEFVETHGIVDGIYRLSGVSSNIQKLRGEFEGDSSPDLNRDLYLQDIHCVSSLCKAYFRELPNPLLTYQLYDKFAEAVAIQLEEERLVKIRDVLKELPAQHYRTLEFLMRHLVRMASFSSETNMHARNLAIVWAPNLLRSKDIEASGFNGTAAFMEVRVQSIVVEFILTHVPQLFSGPGGSDERRNSLPFPTAACIQDEGPFKAVQTQHLPNFGNISPGDGPLPIRPYHAIIEGTDKRKGSLKGRKWMSIFNIGGRFPDPRRRHKHSTKEKERPTLRPARSMDSLSTQPYPNEGSRRPGQRLPSVSKSPLAVATPQVPSDAAVSPGSMVGSQYAVTYRRGTGLVSGGGGTQGTYTALDPEGLGVAGSDTLQSRSPGMSTKQGRRAAMHITGPTLVTVPLHITSNLAGVLQRGGADRIIHRGRDHDAGDRADDMSVVKHSDLQPDVSECGDVSVFDSSEVHNSTAVDGDDLGLSGYVQDNFEFLDQMDCSVMDHMDHSVSYQVNEFSVEPPGHSDDEYEIMIQAPLPPPPTPPPPHDPSEPHTHLQPGPDAHAEDPPVLKPHRPLSLDINSRHTKSLSLPYMTSPVRGPEDESSSEEGAAEEEDDDSDVNSYSSDDDDDENMFVKSLPADFLLNNFTEFQTHTGFPDGAPEYEDESSEPLNQDFSANKDVTEAEEHEQVEVENTEDKNGLEDEEITQMEEEDHQDLLMSESTEEDGGVMEDDHNDKDQTSEASTHCSTESPLQMQDESSTMEEEEEEVVGFSPCHSVSHVKDRETADVVAEEEPEDFSAGKQSGVRSDTAERESDEGEDTSQEDVLEMKESDEDMWEDITEEESEGERGEKMEGSATRRPSSGIWEELEDVVCEVIEFAENMQGEKKKSARGSVTREDDMIEDVRIREEEEQVEEVSGGKEVEERGAMEVEEESMETAEDKVPQKLEERDASSEKSEVGEATQGKNGINEEARHHDKQEVVSEDEQKNNRARADEQRRRSVDKRFKEERFDVKEPKDGRSEKIPGGVGRKLVVSKQPRFYQVKAVPVVPPKPQHCKITALTIRHQQQQQQREKRETGVHTEQDRGCSGDSGEEGGGRNERPRERKRDGDDGGATRDANRNSPLSMCFDEAVAIATLRREKEKGCEKEKEKERQRDWSHEAQGSN